MTGDAKTKSSLDSWYWSVDNVTEKCTYGSSCRTSASPVYVWQILRFKKIACQIHKKSYPVRFISL